MGFSEGFSFVYCFKMNSTRLNSKGARVSVQDGEGRLAKQQGGGRGYRCICRFGGRKTQGVLQE